MRASRSIQRKLVVEFLGPDRIAVGQIDRRDDHAVDFGLDIAAVAVVGIAGQADPAQRWRGRLWRGWRRR